MSFGSLTDVSRPQQTERRELTEFRRRFLDDVIHNPGISSPVVVLVKSKQRRLVAEQAKIEDRWGKFTEAGTKVDSSQSRYLEKEAIGCPVTSPTI